MLLSRSSALLNSLRKKRHNLESEELVLGANRTGICPENALRKTDPPSMGDHVTARTATPTKVDSKLSDAHLESLKRREGGREMPLRPRVESSAVRLRKRFYLASTRQNGMLFILLSSKRM
jgi:hypothetical protein